ncbi:MAG: RagB/SusD family nutrient uptake outer membrane protein [Bacteroidales bacterium]|nr:RagB/SusD family nutrient uptake outer membrane protein [Bacteroidales bacterium]MCF8390928.1 RagB/SusD family nutrient uptake outer membrane protein [Bacteroidales bacterium]
MKLKKYIVLAIMLLAGFQACDEEEFLREDPKDNIYADNLLQTYNGYVNMMNSVYAWIRAEKSRLDPSGGIPLTRSSGWTTGVDNGFMNNGHSAMVFVNWPTNINAEMEYFESMFEWLYKIINSTNMVIERAENTDVDWQGGSSEANELKKNYIIGQAKVIRAWAYRHLSYSWGDVPLSLVEISGATYRDDWERNPVAEVRAQMVRDLKFGIEHLPLRDENPANVNAAVARHYLADTYLAMGKADSAEIALRPLCESTEYELMTDRFGSSASSPGNAFMDMFTSQLPSQGNKESLWVLLNTEPENVPYGYELGSYLDNMWLTYYSKDAAIKLLDIATFYTYNGGRGAGRNSITKSALSWYEPQDDRFSEYAIVKFLVMPNESQGLDTVLWTNTDFVVTAGKYDLDHYQWPSTRKWEYVPPDPAKFDERDHFENIMYLRLADSYLLFAEALHMQTKNDEAAIWLNKVRERSNASAINASDVDIDFILDERSRELITEEHRRHALIRTGKLVERVQLYNEFAGPTIGGAPLLWPIPQTVIDANTSRVMEQNPGFN